MGPVGPQLLSQRRSSTSATFGVTLYMQWSRVEEEETSGWQKITTLKRVRGPPQLNERETTSMQLGSENEMQLAVEAGMPTGKGNESEEEAGDTAAEEVAGDIVEAAAEVVRAAEEEAEDRIGEGKMEGKEVEEEEAEEEKREGMDGGSRTPRGQQNQPQQQRQQQQGQEQRRGNWRIVDGRWCKQ